MLVMNEVIPLFEQKSAIGMSILADNWMKLDNLTLTWQFAIPLTTN